MNTIKVGFIGAGDISVLHAQAIDSLEGADLVGLWNITKDLADQKCRLFGCKQYDSAEALTRDPDIDAVFVLTNLETHHKYTLMALEAGKHVYVEKPVGTDIHELEEIRRAANRSRCICMPGHNYIYEPSVMRAQEMLDSGRLGKLVSLYVLYNIHHPEEVAARYPGVIRQILTHHAYIAIYLAGRPTKVSAMKS
ncbi:MAG: Gfo/Idh/MocA family oxidoreductase, partial [Saprospiraceae bacterium]|nr:Gfo/Idh/MocA family oxidoreductase [Saprospiraceae bacterium]